MISTLLNTHKFCLIGQDRKIGREREREREREKKIERDVCCALCNQIVNTLVFY